MNRFQPGSAKRVGEQISAWFSQKVGGQFQPNSAKRVGEQILV